MKKFILLILLASLLTSCGTTPACTSETVGTDDETSVEITEIDDTSPATTTEDTETTETETETTAEETTESTTALEETTEAVFDPNDLKGGTLLCAGNDSNLVQFDDHISILDADGEHYTDLPMIDYIWTNGWWLRYQLLTKSHEMYFIELKDDGTTSCYIVEPTDSGEYSDYLYYSYDSYSSPSLLIDKNDNVLLTSSRGFSVVNGWLINGDVEYHWKDAYSEDLTKVTPDDSWQRSMGPLEDGRIVVADETSFSIKRQPDGAVESSYGGFDKVWYIANDKVFVQKDGHFLLMNLDGTMAADFGEFDPGEYADAVQYQSGWGSDTTYVPSDETDEYGNRTYQQITFDGNYYYVTIDGIKTSEMSPTDNPMAVEFYYIPSTGEYGRIDNVEVGAMEKPVLYLYPTEPTDVSVSFAHPELLKTVYPAYNDGWHVFVQNDGIMTLPGSDREYYALYWEERPTEPYEFTEGFYVDKNYPEFLEEKLSELGLTDREANEFIMYWLPVLEKNGKNLVAFETTESREFANKLMIDPAPDSLLRIAIHIKKVDADPRLPEQKLPSFLRRGFAAIEWGGQVHT